MEDDCDGQWAQIKNPHGDANYTSVSQIPPAALIYCAPEVLLNKVAGGVYCNVWSFGIIAHVLLYPLQQPYSHIASNNKYFFTDYSKTAERAATTSSSHNTNNSDHHQRSLNPWAIGRDLLRGVITPFPPSNIPAASATVHQQELKLHRLVAEITGLCLKPNVRTRDRKPLLTVWDYFQPGPGPHHGTDTC
ncbi:hypothetical protein Pelo_17408 [Pelomyxa schiedti]|nr:hypothetical protein Pelo_17408 [Pelomyxa schiedti]